MASIQDLPNELLEKILLSADLQSVSRCLQVSKTLNGVVTGSTAIQYKLELALEGLQDGLTGRWSTSERLQALRDRREAWKTMKPTSIHVFLAHAVPWRTTTRSHVTWTDLDSRQFHVLQIPSAHRRIPEKEWVIEESIINTLRAEDLVYDPDQDLLAMLEASHHGADLNWVLALRSLTTGQPHPKAPSPVLPTNIDISHWDISGSGVLLFGDYVGAHTQGFAKRFVLYNWKTGRELLNIASSEAFCYAFLSHQYLLIPHAGLDQDCKTVMLSVIDLGSLPFRDEMIGIEDLASLSVCRLALPEMGGLPFGPFQLGTSVSPPRPWHMLDVPFSPDSKDGMISITAHYDNGETPTVVIPLSVILRCIESGKPFFSWEEWGPTNSRLVSAEYIDMLPQANEMTAVIQEPVITYNPDSALPMDFTVSVSTRLYNFRSRKIRKHICEGSPAPFAFSDHSSYGHAGDGHNYPIVTTLPGIYQELRREMMKRHADDNKPMWDLVLGDDSIICIYDTENPNDPTGRHVHEYHIWTF
ncbi:hypothetical protein BXZ70DRAFT_54128 [Cristinia sonorae]|uniref:F-box domain-containing protein n=1 Tax=Cristinia sonorae TaxID=1940300 RepID=A0A8K0US08_9AGAR|nr:hypothetical protein BXZ70DRAFT_54128 [Cristinia sonorae]